MYARDSKAAGGGGYVVVDYGWKKDTLGSHARVAEYCMRWKGRDDFGAGIAVKDTYGDLCGYQMWPVNTRRQPAWRHAFPVVTVKPHVTTPGGGGTGGEEGDSTPPDEKFWVIIPGGPGEPPPNFTGYWVPSGFWIGYYGGSGQHIATTDNGNLFGGGGSGSGSKPKSADASKETKVTHDGTDQSGFLDVATGGKVTHTTPHGKIVDSPNVWGVVSSQPHFTSGGTLDGGGYHVNDTQSLFGNATEFPGFIGGGFADGAGDVHAFGIIAHESVHRPNQPAGPDTIICPTIGPGYDADPSLAAVRVDTDVNSPRPFWPSFPYGTYGVSLSTMDVDRQIEDFMPCDPRMCAVHMGPGQTDSGSLVYDVRQDGGWDDSRGATYQTHFRVVKGFGGILTMRDLLHGTGTVQASFNSLALNIGRTGQGDGLGGFVVDRCKGKKCEIGRMSTWDGGPFDTAGLDDKHILGTDADGNQINPLHLTTHAFFCGRFVSRSSTGTTINHGGGPGETSDHTGDGDLVADTDGPLNFESSWEKGTDFSRVVKVHCAYDPEVGYSWPEPGGSEAASGAWGWWSTTVITESTPGGATPGRKKPPVTGDPGDPPGGGPVPGGSPPGGPKTPKELGIVRGDVDPIVGKVRGGSSSVLVQRIHAVTTAEIALPGLLARPQLWRQDAPDLRNKQGWGDADAVYTAELTTPVVGRLSVFGAQGGAKGGPYLAGSGSGTHVAGDPWGYTQRPGVSREGGGTAPGGWWVLPPEVDGSDVDVDFAPKDVTLSPTYFATGPGAMFGSGLPELASGGVRSGWSWGQAVGSTVLSFRAHNSSGTATAFLNLDASANRVLPGDDATVGLGSSAKRLTELNLNVGMFFWAAAGDANPTTKVLGGRIEFGGGAGAATDVSILRTAALSLSVGSSTSEKVGFHGFAAAQDTGYSSSGLGVRKTIGAATTLAELLEWAATVQAALIAKGVVGA